jgi:threonine/homoserine/homoserine lactone efflux protein
MTLSVWLSVLAVCTLGAMSPGPSLALVVRHSVVNSRVHGLAAALAHALGVGLYALLTTLGLALVLTRMPRLFTALAVAGAAYLFWLGVTALRSAGPGRGIDTAVAAPAGPGHAAREGFLIAFLNPKIAVFFVALFSQFVHPGMSAREHALLWATATGVDGLWYACVALVLTRRGIAERLRRHAALIDRISGTVLIALGSVTLWRVLTS